jgi:mRNA interferase RelE/StbE
LTWKIEWDDKARKELRRLEKQIQKKIFTYIRERAIENPRHFGKALSHDKVGLWRYRVEDYRIICRIDDFRLVLLVVTVAHRKEVYK